MARKPPPKRSLLILARTITAIVSIALAEGMLALLGYPPWRAQQISSADVKSEYQPDPELGWINRPGQYDMAASGSAPFRYTNWTQGRRATSENPAAADDPRPHLIVVGDSYAYGYGLGDADTFAWRVQQNHPELQVSNYGTPGYGTYQSYIAMDRALDCKPPNPSVLYLLNGFHESRNVADPSWIRVVRHPDNGVFFRYAVLSNGALEGRSSSGDAIWSLSHKLRTVAMAEEYYEMAEAWTRVHNQRAVTQAILTRMEHSTQLSGAKFTVILFDLEPKDRQVYRQFLTARGIAFIDCDHPELKDKTYRQADGHPNAKLNQLLARWVDPDATVATAAIAP
jgi:hypothetical protein